MWLKTSGLLVTLFMLTACGEKPAETTPAQDEQVTEQQQDKPVSVMLRYQVEERGVDPYETVMVITNDFIRIDDDDNPRNFVLVNRKEETVYSVSDDNDAILVVHKTPVDIESPMKITLGEHRVEQDKTPSISGKPTTHYVFEANNKVCYQAVVAEGLLPEVSGAMREYLEMLAGQHASTMRRTPADLINACDLSTYIFNPGRHLKHGLPVREWDGDNYRRQIIDIDDDYDVPEGLFELPGDLERFNIQKMTAKPAAAQP